MKIGCTQCGASLRVLESDFYLRCPYCEACIVVRPGSDMPSIVKPVFDANQVERLFPSEAVESVELRYFPYLESDGRLTPGFNQAFDELIEYAPPSGNRTVWSSDDISPESTVPFDDSVSGREGRTVFHPFYLVMLSVQGYSQGVLVDGVSGRLLGANPLNTEKTVTENPQKAALSALLWGIFPSIVVYLLCRSGNVNIFTGISFSIFAAAGTVFLVNLIRRSGEKR